MSELLEAEGIVNLNKQQYKIKLYLEPMSNQRQISGNQYVVNGIKHGNNDRNVNNKKVVDLEEQECKQSRGRPKKDKDVANNSTPKTNSIQPVFKNNKIMEK